MLYASRYKDYLDRAYYHIYNRGLNRMEIFSTGDDYERFIDNLRITLTSPKKLQKEIETLRKIMPEDKKLKKLYKAASRNAETKLHKNIELLSFCVMPNHFHLLVYQRVERGIEELMRRVTTAYSKYYNLKNGRTGPLFESRYWAICLHYEPLIQVLLTARYVERNPMGLPKTEKIRFEDVASYPYSSFGYYLQSSNAVKTPAWINTRFLNKTYGSIKERPNGFIEVELTRPGSYVDFVTEECLVNPEDVKLDHLSRLSTYQ